ncbi:hypothetical protein ACFCX4_04770 [Kitasatospora sp. NPDC056327]|uniref:hypothetical protein n=1 Tax=Kitasatospora sp. NPDC056327 TaxID=3345785 RepID=UPI0035DE075D
MTATRSRGPRNRWPEPDPDSGVADVALLIPEWLGEQGINAMVRVDAERVRDRRPPWTSAANGGRPAAPFGADGATAAQCTESAPRLLREAGVDVPVRRRPGRAGPDGIRPPLAG